MLVSELASLALAPLFLSHEINGIVYIIVGFSMSLAGVIILRKNRYPHLHLGIHWHEMPPADRDAAGNHSGSKEAVAAPPPHWAIAHGFIAGFGFGGFSLFINTIAAPAMPNPWMGFLPGLLFGLGTMVTLVIIGGLFGAFLRWTHSLTAEEIKRIGAQTGGRTLFFGGLLFGVAGSGILLGLERHLPVDTGYLLMGLFIIIRRNPTSHDCI